MVAVFNKELLSWYLIAVKLNQAVETGLQNAQSPTNNSRSIEFPQATQETDQPLINPLQIPINDGETSHVVEEEKPPESDWVIGIKEKLDQARTEDAVGPWARLSIYRIPQCLRDTDDKAYIPQTVSLGPYHHGKRRLRGMDRHKWRALHHVLKRTNQRIELYLEAVKDVEERARACYEGPISLSSNDFVEMMVLDACFVLELFRGAAAGFTHLGYSRNDPIFAMRGAMHSIQRDMIMLENQIPLFILDGLYGLQSGNPGLTGVVARLALRFFDPLMPTDEPLTKSDRDKLELSNAATFDPLTEQGGLHCLEVFRRSLLAIRAGPKPSPRVWMKRWSHTSRVADKRRQQLIHCVTELKDAGIKFKRRKTDRLWDIKFKNGVLKIPRLLIHDGTKSLFLNLIAFEQCHLDCTNDITSYVIFMDNLIDSPGDVSYLHYCGIVENWLGSDAEVAEMFNRLCQEVVFDINDSSLSRLSEQVNRYYDHKWNAWRASLGHKYFNNPWSIISFLAALVLLFLTLAQTFYTVYAYYDPPS
ncbi:transmembrane protein [Perilla frutescens var. hirtella]|nr:transmembrane protein [Perilla frutescens var. hirtella]